MTVWAFIKDLELDLSGMTPEEARKLVSKLDPQEVLEIIADLRSAASKNEKLAKTLNLAISILEFAVTRGIFV